MRSFYSSKSIGLAVNMEGVGSHTSKSTPQYGFNWGMKIFGQSDWEVIRSKLDENLLGMDVVHMLDPKHLDRDLVKKALPYLIFLKRKHLGKIKARGCTNGYGQHNFISKEETRSPTVSIYALMCSCAIDAIEGRKVITCNIPGAFLQSDWPKNEFPTYLRFDGAMVDIICKIEPKYKSYVINTRKGNRILYGEMNKAVYGSVLSSVLFYNKLSMFLQDNNFEINSYDGCTFNKMVDGSQLTIQFHLDDLKCSHRNQQVLEDVINLLNNKFKTKTEELLVTRGTVHDYLGLKIDYTNGNYVKFTMYDYLEDILKEADEKGDMKGTAVTPANDNLFTVDESSPKLSEKQAKYFHPVMTRFLFVAKRERPDLQVCVSYLCT